MFRTFVKTLSVLTLCGGCSVVSSHQAEQLPEGRQNALIEPHRLTAAAMSVFAGTSGTGESALTERDRLWILEREEWMNGSLLWKSENVRSNWRTQSSERVREDVDKWRRERIKQAMGCIKKSRQKGELKRCLNH